MAYNPFAGNSGASRNFRKPPRWPDIFETKLTSLDWKCDGNARKRSRAEAENDINRGRSRNDRRRIEQGRDEKSPAERGTAQSVPESAVGPGTQPHYVTPADIEPVTIMGIPALADDRVRTLVNFMLKHVRAPDIEIEAKLGVLIEKHNNKRAVELVPVMCETPLFSGSNADTRFESNVEPEIFQTLNHELNKRVNETATSRIGRVAYTRTKEIDVYWPGKIRETRVCDNSSGKDVFKTVRVQSKRRLDDLNVLCPGSVLDVRYSASVEQAATLPTQGAPQMQRTKDRISYKFDYLSVDITMVKMDENGHVRLTHEVEVEVEDPALLYKETCKYNDGDATSKLFDIAASLVNTVRLLCDEVRKAQFVQQQQQVQQPSH